ncbi:MAG: hypothetical protein KC586_17710, partial [Myxococcales bacterium]|nr:hypothetical protein [Myxococcales bacterium]
MSERRVDSTDEMSRLPDFAEVDFDAELASPEPAPAPPRAPWTTPEGIAIDDHYEPSALEGVDHLASVPGLPPYVRGPYSTMYVRQPWTVRQYAGFSTAEESNAFYRR